MNVDLTPGEAIYTNNGKALSGGPTGDDVHVGALDHGSIQLHTAPGETVSIFIGGVPVMSCEVVPTGTPLPNGTTAAAPTPIITLHGVVVQPYITPVSAPSAR